MRVFKILIKNFMNAKIEKTQFCLWTEEWPQSLFKVT